MNSRKNSWPVRIKSRHRVPPRNEFQKGCYKKFRISRTPSVFLLVVTTIVFFAHFYKSRSSNEERIFYCEKYLSHRAVSLLVSSLSRLFAIYFTFRTTFHVHFFLTIFFSTFIQKFIPVWNKHFRMDWRFWDSCYFHFFPVFTRCLKENKL